MDVSEVLLHILVVLLAAKAAAEISERVGVPPVVGEILAGVLIGPSALGLVGSDEVLRVLGELGVILLLLQVGLEMNLRELGAVGRASLTVATVGVAVPFAAGAATGLAFSMSGKEALFVGAALTATSVGITARVFGDLRALASVEARTVLGAAVADDVIGLVILTVVTRLVSEGSVSVLSVLWILAVAVVFLIGTTAVGTVLAPPVFAVVARYSRSSGTLVAVALAFTLALAQLADAAQLAPIVGAFVAGLALGRAPPAERIRRELTPVGHLLIPVFFLQIGIDADIASFADPTVLRLAAALLAVAVVGKLAAAAGLMGAPGDRLLVGIGMVPRGEVGLIFATLGLRQAVFGDDVYAALLLVVLATTVLTPPALRQRLVRMRRARRGALTAAGTAGPDGWLLEHDGVVELVAEPPPGSTLVVALEAAHRCDTARPGASLLDWLANLPTTPLRFDRASRQRFLELLDVGARPWRLLATSGVLERALPDLGAAVSRRQGDAAELDPLRALRWPRLARLREIEVSGLDHPERLRLAALVLDATEEDPSSPVVVARRTMQRLDLGAAAEQAVANLVADAGLFLAAARRIDGLAEEPVLQLAAHLGSAEQARALELLTIAGGLDDNDRQRLATLHRLVQQALAHPELVGRTASNTVEQRRAEASRLVGTHTDARERLQHAPRAYLLAVGPADLARQVELCDPVPRVTDAARVAVTPAPGRPTAGRIDIVARDRPGLLARETQVLAALGVDVDDAVVATWGDGCALASFLVHAASLPDGDRLTAALRNALRGPLSSQGMEGMRVEFDDEGSPWHTLCTVVGPDRRGLLHALTTALAAAGANVHAARVRTDGGRAVDVFELTDAKGRKLNRSAQDELRHLLSTGVTERRPRWRWRRRPTARPVSVAVS
jgi:Kef-type K+ transport system membrane component KefB/predicted amino acid-binding ACT domain protein